MRLLRHSCRGGRLAILYCCMLVCGAIGPLPPSAAGEVKHVIHVVVDGLGASFMQKAIDAGKAPTLKRLQDEGAWTGNARTDYSFTKTIPNFTSILTARPVEQPDGMAATAPHGYTLNGLPEPDVTLHNAGNPNVDYIASVFDVVHDAGLSTGLYVSEDKFILFKQSYNEAAGAPGPHGRDKIDSFVFERGLPPSVAGSMNRRLVADMAARHFNYAFVHYDDFDTAGHAFGWGRGPWQLVISTVDSYLSEVLALVEKDSVLHGHTAIIVTADHGGKGTDHDDNTLPANYTVPVIVWGPGVGHGDLYTMNADSRVDPGTSRPDYSAARQPIRNSDTTNLALKLLGLGPIPGSLVNAKQDLHVALVGDYNRDGKVDVLDYITWRNTRGSKTDLRADGNGNGVVDEADFELWKAHFGGDTRQPESPNPE